MRVYEGELTALPFIIVGVVVCALLGRTIYRGGNEMRDVIKWFVPGTAIVVVLDAVKCGKRTFCYDWPSFNLPDTVVVGLVAACAWMVYVEYFKKKEDK